MSQDVAKFIAMVGLHFPAPKVNDEQAHAAWCASMVRLLDKYPAGVLADAADKIIRERDPKKDGRFFPAPSECIAACEEAAQLRRAKETPLLEAPKEPDAFSYGERVELARDFMKTTVAKRAITEGWGQSLFHFVVRNRRLPNDAEIVRCKREAQQFAAEYERLLRGEHPFGRPLARLAESMVRKAKELMGNAA